MFMCLCVFYGRVFGVWFSCTCQRAFLCVCVCVYGAAYVCVCMCVCGWYRVICSRTLAKLALICVCVRPYVYLCQCVCVSVCVLCMCIWFMSRSVSGHCGVRHARKYVSMRLYACTCASKQLRNDVYMHSCIQHTFMFVCLCMSLRYLYLYTSAY
jgi:hypothetical protein